MRPPSFENRFMDRARGHAVAGAHVTQPAHRAFVVDRQAIAAVDDGEGVDAPPGSGEAIVDFDVVDVHRSQDRALLDAHARLLETHVGGRQVT